jgi:hypothetical protein
MTYKFDDIEVPAPKYIVGTKEPSLSQIAKYTFAFAYDYISLNKTRLCFDNDKIPARDYHELYYLKQEISGVKVSDIQGEKRDFYRFHSIDYAEKRKWLFTALAKTLNVKVTNAYERDQLPTLYQIEVYTDNVTQEAPRIVGFFGNYGIFHLVWFDYEHQIYPKVNTENITS